ncbi:OB-fold domain-containing protein [Gordonia polyisoprenivorans]|uniref:OB-fold domain-containing protein n=1 Tax=Gordonia polyisoprenivorans TaxID=84595 RepID=UPI0030CF4E04
MSNAVLAYASYLPDWRVSPRSTGSASRVVASFDEDATTMAVAATHTALSAAGRGVVSGGSVVLVTSTPPYLDKTNAVAVHAALSLDRTVAAYDAIGTARTAMGAIRAATRGGPTVIAAADVRVGRVGSADERRGSDAAATVVIGRPAPEVPAIAEILTDASLSEEFLDRWREPVVPYAATWEERFGYERYAPLIREAAGTALDSAGLAEADHVVLTCPNTAVAKRSHQLVKGTLSTSGSPIGFAGAGDPLLGLAAVLDTAGPGETILLISAVDGVDVIVMRTTAALASRRQPIPVAHMVDKGGQEVPYTTYLSWRGFLDVEPPRRPEPERPAGPPSARSSQWKFGLQASRCTACRFVHAPPMRVCRSCGTTDEMEAVPMASKRGRIATFTVDHLAYSPSPPVVDVVVDFDGGGRSTFEVADARPELLAVGAPVDMVFRTLLTAGGVHNYFWKARQLADSDERTHDGQ